jgi:hypothetical protein
VERASPGLKVSMAQAVANHRNAHNRGPPCLGRSARMDQSGGLTVGRMRMDVKPKQKRRATISDAVAVALGL